MTDPSMEATPDRAEVTGARGRPERAPAAALAPEARRLPSVDLFAVDPAPAGDHNPVYRELVGDRAEIVDLLAYAIYKQHKHDFREAFFAAYERDPTSAELAAYIVGESTPRRLAAYRFLAAAKLAGEDGSAPGAEALAAPTLAARPGKKGQWRQVAWLTTMLLGLIVLASVALKVR